MTQREFINEHDHRSSTDLFRAAKIAFAAHAGQTDKAGEPYFAHCKRVADALTENDQRIVAFLHDVVEKGSGWSLDRLEHEGFSSAIVAAVDALTMRPGEDDDDFVVRAATNRLARPVKVADLEDNLEQAERAVEDPSKFQRGLKIVAKIRAGRH
ncbi:HD domain-containing protein (plasmid) [Rhizobium grahamii]|uniref:HD domain-containing protein n=1 Tax=Rhizobium grahamii TaxID=1120045 RepID=A0A5Q0CCM1_9HYPH|nr:MULTISPECIES: HD domain-containing protein [Rhizobium]QFY63153.1 HD domain-containing protein [Rhizobium grahamii]QRM52085.1 HD domain-containing protein [Rhizobium sp. BG6]